jgi:hypothetical protein
MNSESREESSRFPDLRLSSLQMKKLALGEGGEPSSERRGRLTDMTSSSSTLPLIDLFD